MTFRHPLEAEFDRLQRELSKESYESSLKGVTARVQSKLLGAFIRHMVIEREANTPVQHVLHSTLLTICNILLGVIWYTVPDRDRREALSHVSRLLEQQATHIDVPKFKFLRSFEVDADQDREKFDEKAGSNQ